MRALLVLKVYGRGVYRGFATATLQGDLATGVRNLLLPDMSVVTLEPAYGVVTGEVVMVGRRSYYLDGDAEAELAQVLVPFLEAGWTKLH